MHALSHVGMVVPITGGIFPEDIYLFARIKTETFIVSQALSVADGAKAACAFRHEIMRY